MSESNKQEKQATPTVKTVWQSAWCSVGSATQVQARVGRSKEGFHAGVATAGDRATNVAWGPAGPDEKSAKMIAQAAAGQALEKRSAAKEFGAMATITPPTRGRSR